MANDEFAPVWAVGFMSGTSIDAVDAAMIRTDGTRIYEFGPTSEQVYSATQRKAIQRAVQAARDWNWDGDEPSEAFVEAESVLNDAHIAAYEQLLHGWSGEPPAVIGVHGQTVLHRRPVDGKRGATRQILNAEGLQNAFGRPIAFDFRSKDVAAGGEGAPLAPIYHKALIDSLPGGKGPAVVLNLGGVANITWVGRNDEIIAFDTGPANGPIDEWVEGHGKGRFDKDGAFASAGRVHEGLLTDLLSHPYFGEAPPKSLDRFDFNANMVRGLSLEDGAATLSAFSARAVLEGLKLCPELPDKVILCGGGRRNPYLVQTLRDVLPMSVLLSEELGWRGDSIEAEAFALLAVRRLREMPISFPKTTGVPAPMTGGQLMGV